MRLIAEKIQFSPDESFRLLRWHKHVHDAEAVTSDGMGHPFRGMGDLWHYHTQTELTLVTKGSGLRFIGDTITPFKAPDLVLIGSGLPHYWHESHPSSGYAIQLDFAPEHPFWQFPEARELSTLWKDADRGIHLTGKALPELTNLICSSAACGGMGRLARLMRILELLAALPSKNRLPISSQSFAAPTRQSTYCGIQTAIHLIFHNFQNETSLADLLRQTGMSKATFTRQFVKHTGKTFTQFVTEVRLNFASRQLIETDLPVSEIAFSSGFNNLSHFNHLFKALYRLSPRAFRCKMAPNTGR